MSTPPTAAAVTSTRKHRMVTMPRGTTDGGRPGFAARCEEAGCGAVTFGGFETRTAARGALRGHEAEAPRFPAAVVEWAERVLDGAR